MKKVIYVLIVSLVVVSGVVFASRETKSSPKPPSDVERKLAMDQWEATPEGMEFKKWEASPAGKNVINGAAKISKHIQNYTNMEAVVTSLSLPPGSCLGFGVMARIDGEDYILRFDAGLQQLGSLKVNDKIIIKSHGVSYAPKYAYPIIAGEYAERDGKIIYKHALRKGRC